jgi:hypothetical protein
MLLSTFLVFLLANFVLGDPVQEANKLVKETKSFLDNAARQKLHRNFLFELLTNTTQTTGSKSQIEKAAKIIYQEGTVNQCFSKMVEEWNAALESKQAVLLKKYFTKHLKCPEAKHLIQERLPKTGIFTTLKYELLAMIESERNSKRPQQDLLLNLQPKKVEFYSNVSENPITRPKKKVNFPLEGEPLIYKPTKKDWLLVWPALIGSFTLMEYSFFLFVRALQ